MRNSDVEAAVLGRIVGWAEAQGNVRVVILTSTRARPGAIVDALSDYDVILYVSDPSLILRDRSWTGDLGPVMVEMPPRGQEHAWRHPTRLVLYEDGTRIDFSILPARVLREARETARLPGELDAGYRVLLDKDDFTTALPIASGSAYVLSPPSQKEFAALVEESGGKRPMLRRPCGAKSCSPPRYSLECVLKLDLLRRMLEWRVAPDHDWTYRPGLMGRGLKAHLPPELWRELEQTYAGADIGENWHALARTIALLRTAATVVGQRLNLEYPHALDARMTGYLDHIRTRAGSDDVGR